MFEYDIFTIRLITSDLNIPEIRIVAFILITKGHLCKITLDNQLLQCVEGHLHVSVPLCASVAAERAFCDERVRQHRTFCCRPIGNNWKENDH